MSAILNPQLYSNQRVGPRPPSRVRVVVATVTDSVGGFSSMITRQEVWMEMAGADQCHFPMAWEATPSWAPCSLYILCTTNRGDKGRFVVSDSPPLVNPQPPGAPWHQPKSHSSVHKELHTREVTCEDGRSVCTKPFPCSKTTCR